MISKPTLTVLDALGTPAPWEEVAIGSEGYQIWGPRTPGRSARIASFTGRHFDQDKANAQLVVLLRNAAPEIAELTAAVHNHFHVTQIPVESLRPTERRLLDALVATYRALGRPG